MSGGAASSDTAAPLRARLGTDASFNLIPWIAGVAFALVHYSYVVISARTSLVERFDGGIQSTTITYLLHGQLPYTDFYEPYGLALGVPGAVIRLLGFDGLYAERLAYGVFPAAVTALATVFVWRRCGAATGLLVGLISLGSNVNRYSMGFVALFGFLLMVDAATASRRDLADVARERPRFLLIAAAVLSLAGWVRMEYAVFVVVWAAFLAVVVPRDSHRNRLVLGSLVLGGLPALLVVASGGLRHLWWFIEYFLSPSASGFHAERGQPIGWSDPAHRIGELLRGSVEGGSAAQTTASYGVALVVMLAAAAVLTTPAGRRRILVSDRTFITPFMLVLAGILLVGQAARYSGTYGAIGLPVFWTSGALLVRRVRLVIWPLLFLALGWTFVAGFMPWRLYDQWRARPDTSRRESIPRLNRIPVQDFEAGSLAALPKAWRDLGLAARPTVSVARRNDIAWGNDAIVGFLLDAPPAGWPLTYDPGLADRDKVQRELIGSLCTNRAPVVQSEGVYPDPKGAAAPVGSRRLDVFLATNYRVVAVAGFYRVLLPSRPHCVAPGKFDRAELTRIRDGELRAGHLPEAGAVALQRMAIGPSPDLVDASVAALGGYRLSDDKMPQGPLGQALRTLADGVPHRGLAIAAGLPRMPDLVQLAAQTAWTQHRVPGESGEPSAAGAVLRLLDRHPDWPQAILNGSAVVPASPGLFRRLARGGARGVAEFDRWRLVASQVAGDLAGAVAAGLDLVADYDRANDPVRAGNVELELSSLPGLEPACSAALRRHADERPGVYAPTPSPDAGCPRHRLAIVAGEPRGSFRKRR